MLKFHWNRLARPGEGATLLRVDSGRPSRPTTKLNVDAAVEFGEFGEFAEATGSWQPVSGLEHGRLMWLTRY